MIPVFLKMTQSTWQSFQNYKFITVTFNDKFLCIIYTITDAM